MQVVELLEYVGAGRTEAGAEHRKEGGSICFVAGIEGIRRYHAGARGRDLHAMTVLYPSGRRRAQHMRPPVLLDAALGTNRRSDLTTRVE